MKLRNVAKGVRAVKTVTFRLANAPEPRPVELGEEPVRDEHTIEVGVRVLTGGEYAEALSKAQADAQQKGVKEWLDTHPLCRLYEMVHVLAVACVDTEARDEPFFASAQEILDSPEVGEDNIAYLYALQRAWQDECSPFIKDFTAEQVVALLATEAERPENAAEQSPFSRMRASTLESFFRITARLFQGLLITRLVSTSPDALNTSELSKNSENETEQAEPEPVA